jgi:hypothetical protein
MINLHEAVYSAYPNTAVVRGNDVESLELFDKDENSISYNKEVIEAKLAEMQQAELTAWQDKDIAKQSAIAKLAKLGLTEDEVKALIGQ